jgi:hypothetical protein
MPGTLSQREVTSHRASSKGSATRRDRPSTKTSMRRSKRSSGVGESELVSQRGAWSVGQAPRLIRDEENFDFPGRAVMLRPVPVYDEWG